MTHLIKKSLVLSILLVLLVSGCAQAPADIQPTAEPPTSQPAVAVLDLTQATTAAPPAPENIQPAAPATATEEPAATPTPEPTFTPIPFVVATTAASGCTNQAEFIKHLTISDNTTLKPEKSFGKMWQVRNAGTCTWTTAYKLVFISGNPMQGPSEVFLPHDVLPGETVDLRVNFISPGGGGSYESSWMFQDQDGNFFGVGRDSDQMLMVKINVPEQPINHQKRL